MKERVERRGDGTGANRPPVHLGTSRTSTKIAFAIGTIGMALVTLHGALVLHYERLELLDAVEQHMRMLGEVLHVAVENALRDGQTADIREMLRAMDRVDTSLDIFVTDPQGVVQAASLRSGPIDPSEVELLTEVAQTDHSLFVVADSRRGEVALLALTFSVPGYDHEWRLLVSRSMRDVRADLERTKRRASYIVLTFIGLTALAGLIVGRFYIRTPLRRLAEAMRDVQDEGFATTLPISRNDEFGAVAVEFNRMVDALRAARQERDREADARRALQQRIEHANRLVTVGQLSAGLAHEIGSPLQVLQGRARMLQRKAGDPNETRRIAAIMVTQTERISRIVSQLLHFAKATPRRCMRVDAVQVVSEVVELLELETRRRQLTLTLDVPARIRVVTDPDALQQIVLNLVGNAFAATDPGGAVTVYLRMDRSKRRLPAGTPSADREATRALVLEVRDTGHGVEPTMRDSLFEPFFTTRAGQGGVGLGLAVVRSLVIDQGGTIDVTSEVGVGTTFRVWLPERSDTTSDQQPSDQQPSGEQPSGEQPSDQQPSDQQPSDEVPT